jgi:hypothetical protein
MVAARIMKKKAIISEYLPWLLIGLAVLVLLMISVFLLKDKAFNLIDKIKTLFGR